MERQKSQHRDQDSSVKTLTHTLQKPALDIGAVNSTPDSGAGFSCRLHLARKKAGADLWRRN